MVTVDRATVVDAETIAELIGELEAYYRGGDARPGDLGQVRAALFGDRPVATVLLARDGDQVVGMASYSFLWPAAGAETSLYLKELYVRETARRRGAASALMNALQQEAAAAGCRRVEWTADRYNPAALGFYEALGAEQEAGRVCYRVER